MPFTAQEEALLKRIINGLTDQEADALALTSQERRVEEIEMDYKKRKLVVDTAYVTFFNSLNNLKAAIMTKTPSQIESAKAQFAADRNALVAALQAAK